MTKYYADSEEKYLKGILLYAIEPTGGESIGLFYDAEGAQQAYDDDYDWEDLFLKGLIRVRLPGNRLANPAAFLNTSPKALGMFDLTSPIEFFQKDSDNSSSV